MKWRALSVAAILSLAVVAAAYYAGIVGPSSAQVCMIRRTGSIALPNSTGRLDHMAYDPTSGRLFVAALGNDSLDVVDVNSSRLVRAVGGFSQPQGVLLLQEGGSLVVTNGGDGTVDVLNANTLTKIASLSLGSDADNLRYDPNSGLVYVAYGEGGIAAINPVNGTVLWRVALLGHPESFELSGGASRLYANVPAGGYVAVIDTNSRTVAERWALGNATGNYPMALDRTDGLIFVATRSPPQLLALDAATGRIIAQVPVAQDPDDVYYDGGNGCVYVSSGAGYVTVIKQMDISHYSVAQEVATGLGARTSLLDSESGQYFVADPASEGSQAEVLQYSLG